VNIREQKSSSFFFMFQVEWGRFLRELGAEIPVLQDFAGEEVHFDGGKSQG